MLDLLDWRSVSGAGVPNVKGPWCELVAGTPEEAAGLELVVEAMTLAGGLPEGYLVDVGVGSVGAEQTVAPNLTVRGWAARFTIPVYVPKGFRVAARFQAPFPQYLSVRMTLSLWLAAQAPEGET